MNRIHAWRKHGRVARTAGLGLLLILLLLLVSPALFPSLLAQTGGGYDLTWSAVAGGGRTFSSGGPYVLGSTIGQAGAGQMSGGR